MSPKIRQTIYLLGTAVISVIGILLLWGGIDQGTADSMTQMIAGLMALLGAGAPAVAAVTVSKQNKAGAFDTVAPADQVISGVQAIIDAQTHAASELDRVKTAVSDVLIGAPVLGPLARQLIDGIDSMAGVHQGGVN